MLEFQKYHGLGNDFIIINTEDQERDWGKVARKVCQRRFAVGADGLMTCTVKEGKPLMRIFNPDGSEAEMCGNGLRCFVHHLYRHGLFPGKTVEVHTKNGLLQGEVLEEEGNRVRIANILGIPEFQPGKIPVNFSGERFLEEKITVADEEFKVSAVRTGPPHAVIFVSDLEGFPAQYWGPLVEKHPVFPNKANINFTQLLTPDRIRVVVWERGVGLTQACGTGATAATVIGQVLGKLKRNVMVELPGGSLEIKWNGLGTPATMVGNSQYVFKGNVDSQL